MWKSAGRPRSGDLNACRVRSKLRYKNAIKEAKASADLEFNEGLYSHLCTKDVDGFWKTWRRKFCSNNIRPTCVLNGRHGDENIMNEFVMYYKSVNGHNPPRT